MPNRAMKIICIKLNEIEDIPEKTLSESKNYTLVCLPLSIFLQMSLYKFRRKNVNILAIFSVACMPLNILNTLGQFEKL